MIIFSAERKEELPEVNRQRSEFVRRVLDRDSIPHEMVRGRYDGAEETSILVHAEPGSERAMRCERLAFAWDQESVLEVNQNRMARLRYRDGSITPLGRWRDVTGLPGFDNAWTETSDGRRWSTV